jgi:CHAT domain-containing protein
VLALGDPAFPDAGTAAVPGEGGRAAASEYRSAFGASGGLARLAASADEARLVARYGRGSVVRLRDAASESYFVHAPLARFGVIHLATHALVDESGATNTAIALAPGEGDDGFVSPAELAKLDLRADLVVLSACRTAGGVIVSGEGVQGLTAPLLQAGARAVVATEWRIADRETVRFVGDLYDALAGGSTVVDALRAAKLRALRRGAPPGEWAAFTAVGDPVARVALRRPRFPALPGHWVIAAAALLLAACGGALYWRTSRARSPERGVPAEPSPVRTHH